MPASNHGDSSLHRPDESVAYRRYFPAIGAVAIVLATLVVYWPAIRGSFILDDDDLITRSPLIKAPDGLSRIWFTTEAPEYYPIAYSAMWFEWRLFGMSTSGYHLVNLVFHIGSALVLWQILKRLRIPGAYLAALLFAVHPVNVESAAWIVQIRNVLAMFFSLMSLWFYIRTSEQASLPEGETLSAFSHAWPRSSYYWLSLLAFIVAMFCKGSAAILPAVCVLLHWWTGNVKWKAVAAQTAPFFVVAICLTLVNIWFQTHGEKIVVRDVGAAARIAGAGAVIWFYLSKAILPLNLIFVYPQWTIDIQKWQWWIPLAAAVSATVLLFSRRRSFYSRALLFAWVYFCIALVPVLGLTDVGYMRYSLVADHYQYFAVIGVVSLVAAAWKTWSSASTGATQLMKTALMILVVGSVMSVARAGGALPKHCGALQNDHRS